MPDNTGQYCSRGQLLIALANGGQGTATSIALSAKTATTPPAAKFTFAPASPVPAVGDWVVQGVYSAQIISLPTGTEIEIDDATNFSNGMAKLVKNAATGAELDDLINQAMAFIDLHTRQWFNARTVTMRMLGYNSPLLQLGVPIISITSLKLNENYDLQSFEYLAPNSRTYPDDRRNPRILLRATTPDIFTLTPRVFSETLYTEIVGVFGFLEADGSTPSLIQRATLKLAVMRAINTAGSSASSSASSSGLGPIKREKTDLHEIEYFNPNDVKSNSPNSGTGLSGDDEVDDIIASYKSPILIGGSVIDYAPAQVATEPW